MFHFVNKPLKIKAMIEITQTERGNYIDFRISINYCNGTETVYNIGNLQKESFIFYVNKIKLKYIKKITQNYIQHKKKLLSLDNCLHYPTTANRLFSLDAALQLLELIKDEKNIVNICKRILNKEKELVTLMEGSHKDADRLTSILVFAKENSI